MVNDRLHELFHELFGAINGIDLLSQMCAQFITVIKLDKLEGSFKEEMSSNFKNISFYYNRAFTDLTSVVNALAEIRSEDIGISLKKSISHDLEKVKEIMDSAGKLYSKILKVNTRTDLLRFAHELEKLEPICQAMAKTIRSSKEKLSIQGKY